MVDTTEPAGNTWVVLSNGFEVAEEDSVVGWVEAGDCGVQPDVGFCDMRAEEEGTAVAGDRIGEVSLETIKGLEKWVNICIESFLSGCEATLVDTIVDCVVDPFVHLVNLLAEMFWVEAFAVLSRFTVLRVDQVIELGVEHSNDFG